MNISLRDHFAAKALPSLIQGALNNERLTEVDVDEVAVNAFRIADAMVSKSYHYGYPEQQYTSAISAFSGHA